MLFLLFKTNLTVRNFFTVVLVLLAGALFAQKGTIRGTIFDKSSGEPVIFTNVLVKELGTGASTDINGLYQIGPIKPGTYTLIVSNVEYETYETTVELVKGQIKINKRPRVEASRC